MKTQPEVKRRGEIIITQEEGSAVRGKKDFENSGGTFLHFCADWSPGLRKREAARTVSFISARTVSVSS